MVVTELKGGLGNQLFQYAAALSLAKEKSTPLKVDVTCLETADEILGTYRNYKLRHLDNPPKIADAEELNYFNRFRKNKFHALLPFRKRKVLKEPSFSFYSSFFKYSNHVLMTGNWQSESYFSKNREVILAEISFHQLPLYTDTTTILSAIQSSQSVGVHIRRGDYVTNKIANDVLGTLPISYYEKASQVIQREQGTISYFVFSDDIQWASSNLPFLENAVFVDIDAQEKDITEFYLMSQCKHQIIANSSFSWWAAWLNTNQQKKVIAPEKWFNKAKYDTKDLIPSNWIRV
jgi:Glycosyl transferase family 11